MTTAQPRVPDVAARPRRPLRGSLGPAAGYAFSDRADGSMSSSVGAGDHRSSRDALARGMGLGADDIAWMHQVHGADVAIAGQSPEADPVPTCDGIVGIGAPAAVAVLVADCVPVLMAAPAGVAAAHSGRPGLVAGVGVATARRLCTATGCGPEDLDVVIGPAIGPCCYEVPGDMADAVERAVPGTRSSTTWGTDSLDLVGGVIDQLTAFGVTRIGRAGGCTRCEGEGRWFSHRATGGSEGRPAGRQAGVVALRAEAGLT